jgi:hypothetical protein
MDETINNWTYIDDGKKGSENDFRSNEKHFTATGSGNLWNAEANVLMGGALTYKNAGHATTMWLLCQKRSVSHTYITLIATFSAEEDTDELDTQHGLPPKKTS